MLVHKSGDFWGVEFDSYWRVVPVSGLEEGETFTPEVVQSLWKEYPQVRSRFYQKVRSTGLGIFLVMELQVVLFPVTETEGRVVSTPLIRSSCRELDELFTGTRLKLIFPKPSSRSLVTMKRELGNSLNEIVVLN